MNIIPLQFANTRSGSTAAFAREQSSFFSTDILTGIAIAAIIPAIFWTGLVWGVSFAFNLGISSVTLAAMATAIAGFLSVVCSAVIAAE